MAEPQNSRIDDEAETLDSQPDAQPGTGDRDEGLPARIPDKIGHYRIKRVIAAGGMGIIYEAVQDHPRRTVALKVIKQGIASRSALRRFEYEAQILARLRHPGIAQVYEAGMHDDGSGGTPFFAMEYIAGAKDIVEYAEAKASTRPASPRSSTSAWPGPPTRTWPCRPSRPTWASSWARCSS
ncbi:MAG: protein kinase [Planctomycetota bacterium]|jgi:serine/threonine protein kinase